MWICRNCNAENADKAKACAKCGEKHLNPPKGAKVKLPKARKTEPVIVTLLKASAWVDAVAGAFVLMGILINAPAGGFMLMLCVAAVTLTMCALLCGMASIIQKL